MATAERYRDIDGHDYGIFWLEQAEAANGPST